MQKIFIRHLKELQGDLSVTAFAKMLEMPQNTLDCYIKERRKPSVDFILRICSKCGVSADWLLGLTEARDYTRNYTKLSVPTSPPPPIEEKFNSETIALMQQIRNLESRIKALETQPTFACG